MTDEPDDPRAADRGRFASAGDPPVDLARFRARRHRERLIAALDALADAALRRDVPALFNALSSPDAREHLPHGVREELLRISRLPHADQRVPLRLYHYRWVLLQLGDEPMGLDEPDLPGDPSAPRAPHVAPVVPLPVRRPH